MASVPWLHPPGYYGDQISEDDIGHCMVSNLCVSSGILSSLLIDQVVWKIKNFSNNKFYISVICVVL